MGVNLAAATHRVGEAAVTKILDLSLTLPAGRLLPDYDPAFAIRDPTTADLRGTRDEPLTLDVHSWLVRVGALTVLVDAGAGNGKRRSSAALDQLDTPWLARLAATGVRPEEVTHVLLTHLHTDHVGWNTVPGGGGWVPTFPNARYLIPRLGYERFAGPDGRARANYDMFADSVRPVVEAGQADLVATEGGEPLAGFTYIPTPGHSLDHMSILFRSDGREGLFAGDVLHHPVQVAYPNWCSMFCEDPEQARQSRRRVLDLAADRQLTYFSSHFPGASCGRISRANDRFSWESDLPISCA